MTATAVWNRIWRRFLCGSSARSAAGCPPRKSARLLFEKRQRVEEAREAYRREHGTAGQKQRKRRQYLLVDGYNVIYARQDLADLARENPEAARGKLTDILCNYQGYLGCELIPVFDAYRVKGNPGEVQRYHNIYVVYTKEAETADAYRAGQPMRSPGSAT